jgi:hypothetical protein
MNRSFAFFLVFAILVAAVLLYGYSVYPNAQGQPRNDSSQDTVKFLGRIDDTIFDLYRYTDFESTCYIIVDRVGGGIDSMDCVP